MAAFGAQGQPNQECCNRSLNPSFVPSWGIVVPAAKAFVPDQSQGGKLMNLTGIPRLGAESPA